MKKLSHFLLLVTFITAISCTKTEEVYPELPTIQFQAPTQSTFQESLEETQSFTVLLSEASSTDEVINLNFAGTAQKGVDYEVITPLPLVIKKGEKSVSFSIKIKKDQTFESGTENAIIIFSSLSKTIKLGLTSSIEFNIYDGKALIGFELASKDYIENVDYEAVKVVLDKPINEDIVVYLSSSGSNSGYYNLYSASKAIIIKAGETSALAYVDTYDSRVNTAAQALLTLKIDGVKNDDVAIHSTLNTHKMNISDYQTGLVFTTSWTNSSVDMDMYIYDENGYYVTSTYGSNVPIAISRYLSDGTYYFYLSYYTSSFLSNTTTINVTNNITNTTVGSFNISHFSTKDDNVLKIVKSGDSFTVTQIKTSL